jgi:hypothetical protein|uniref:ORF48 n=1 Tax=Nitrosopumilaceae spindle-shaped virus TaxID=3065433 RepID=A0AAT9J7I2_9VIRU
MPLIIYLLNQISQYEVGNIDKLPTVKEYKKLFNSLDFEEIDNFLRGCESQISSVQKTEHLTDKQKKDICHNVLVFYKLAKPIATKKMKSRLMGDLNQ